MRSVMSRPLIFWKGGGPPHGHHPHHAAARWQGPHAGVSFFVRGERMSEWIITTAITLGIGVITYFLKRTMSQVDKHGEEIRRIDSERVTKTDLKESTEELKKDIRQIREDYTPKNVHEKDFDECRADIKQIKAEYLTKDDFIREMNKMDRKLDQMLELMLKK